MASFDRRKHRRGDRHAPRDGPQPQGRGIRHPPTQPGSDARTRPTTTEALRSCPGPDAASLPVGSLPSDIARDSVVLRVKRLLLIVTAFAALAAPVTASAAFCVENDDILLVNLSLSALDGREIVSVINGHIIGTVAEPVQYDRTPGHVRVTAPVSREFIPEWVASLMREHEPDFGASGKVALLDLEVVERGLVRVEGVWVQGDDRAVVITPAALSFVWPILQRPLSFIGEGRATVIHYSGPITSALFGYPDEPPPPEHPQSHIKIGRNEPCPCGSGKKYKRCHGAS
jgi:hypothetical protein